MKERLLVVLLTLSLVLGFFGNVCAQHYLNGIEGIKGASCPPPGYYFKSYNALYFADNIKDGSGKDRLASSFGPGLPHTEVDIAVTLYANVSRFIWVSEKKILGGNFVADLLIPIISYDLEITVPGTPVVLADSHDYGFGDLILEPFALAWHGPRWDAAAALAVIIPTGDETLMLGHYGQWTGLLTVGGTYYFDKNKTLSVSILPRLEIHSEDPASTAEKAAGVADDIIRGADLHFEWGIGKTFAAPKFMVDVGLTGFAQWQITDDHGPGAQASKGRDDEVYAIGPEVGFFIPSIKWMISGRSEFEFGAKGGDVPGRPQGNITTLTLTKIF